MKYLSDYCEGGVTELLQKHKAFFAFSGKQFQEKKVDGVRYTHIEAAGLFCPTNTVEELVKEMEANYDIAVKQDIKENGIENIVKRELGNHETTYTGDLEHIWEVLNPYKELCPELNMEMVRKFYLIALSEEK